MKVGNLKPISIYVFFLHWHVKVFSSKHAALKVDVLRDHKVYCLRAQLCSFQPGNFTGGGSEGVNALFDSNCCGLICGLIL